MHKFLIAVAAAAFAVPAAAQPVDPLEEEMARAIPPAEEVERMAPVMDQAVGAMLNVDVGPIIDAVDPLRRHPGYGRPGRTIGALAGRDDPQFEARLRSDIYGSTAQIGAMMHAFRATAPALAHTVRQFEQAIGAAMDDYHRRAGPPPEYYEPYPED